MGEEVVGKAGDAQDGCLHEDSSCSRKTSREDHTARDDKTITMSFVLVLPRWKALRERDEEQGKSGAGEQRWNERGETER